MRHSWILPLILTIVACTGGSSFKHRVRRIVGGKDAPIVDVPYQLSLQIDNGSGFSHRCGAILISDIWALSAAHCTELITDIGKARLVGGTAIESYIGQVREIEEYFAHESYIKRSGAPDYDISAIRLSQPFALSRNVSPIALPEQDETVADGSVAVASGWGKIDENATTFPKHLKSTAMPVLNQYQCHLFLQPHVTDRMMCTTSDGTGICKGDSGGPLVVDSKLVGVSSFVMGCDSGLTPAVFTKVSLFRNWIKEITGF